MFSFLKKIMPRIRLFHCLVVILTIVIIAVGSAFLPATAQRESQDIQSVPLFDGTEVNSTQSYGRLTKLNEENNGVSIGSQFYHAQFYVEMSTGGFYQLTVAPDPNQYRYLRVVAGVNDGVPTNSSLDVKVYQGGNIVKNYDALRAGDLIKDIDIDLTSREVSNASNIGIRLECRSPGNPCSLHFIQANLVPTGDFLQPSELQGGRSSADSPAQGTMQRHSLPASSIQQPTQTQRQRSNPLTVNDAVNVLNTIRGLFR